MMDCILCKFHRSDRHNKGFCTNPDSIHFAKEINVFDDNDIRCEDRFSSYAYVNDVHLVGDVYLYRGRVEVFPPEIDSRSTIESEHARIDDELYKEFKGMMMRFRAEEAEQQKAVEKLDECDKILKQWKEEEKIK